MKPRRLDDFDLHAFGTALADAIGGGWTRHPCADSGGDAWSECRPARCWHVTLDGPGHAELNLSLDRHAGTVTATGRWPRRGTTCYDYAPRNLDRPSATVNPTRPIAAVVKDLTRRVLIPYLEALPEALARKAAHEAELAAMWTAADALSRRLEERSPRGERADTEVSRLTTSNYDLGIEAKVDLGGRISLTLNNLDLATAERLIAERRAAKAGKEAA